MAHILVIELVVTTKVFGQNVLYFARANVYKPWLNEEKEGEEGQFKAKGPRKISTMAPYSKNACKRHITLD
jgi:hypothetical protein